MTGATMARIGTYLVVDVEHAMSVEAHSSEEAADIAAAEHGWKGVATIRNAKADWLVAEPATRFVKVESDGSKSK